MPASSVRPASPLTLLAALAALLAGGPAAVQASAVAGSGGLPIPLSEDLARKGGAPGDSLPSAHRPSGERLRTPAEVRGYEGITGHEAMVDFYRALGARSERVRIREFGRSAEGRALLEVVVSEPALSDPWEAHASGRPIVLVNALVHGDEPAGMEALMAFARDLVEGPLEGLPEGAVFVLSPALNPDGGEAGPWGTRNNPANLNVNRDYLRLATAETRAWVPGVIAAWQPHVIVDVHELVGPPRIYDFYLSYPLDVAGPTLNWTLTRHELVPHLVEALEGAGFSHFPYHRVPPGLVENPDQGVSAGSYGAQALSSYGGARAAMTVLFESMRPRDAREGLEPRVRRQEVALGALAEWVVEHADRVVATVAEERGELVARGARWNEADSVALQVEQVASRVLPYRLQVEGEVVELEVPVLDSARIALGRVRPVGYLLAPHREEVARHLALHGIQVDRILAPATVAGEGYRVVSVSRGDRAYEGYVPREVVTALEPGSLEVAAGSFLVRMDQPTARIIAHLLEPEDANSMVSMGWFTTEERPGVRLSVARLRELPEVAMERVTAPDARGAPRWRGGAQVRGEGWSPVEVEPERARALVGRSLEALTPHEEVVHFFRSLSARSPDVSMQEIGRSREGRPLHLVTLARPGVGSPAEAHASGRPILFVGAQVHGDEPAGKEGLLRFAHDLVEGPLAPLLEDLVVLLVPQMNPDGAEAGTWGIRNNVAGFNLNRDYLRLDNPEARAVVGEVLLPWRPHVVVDAHELGGPPRIYDFYTWFPTNPHGPASTVTLAAEVLVPAVVEALEAEGHTHIIYHTPGGLNELVERPEVGISVPVYGRTLNDYAASQGLATILYESLRASDARVEIEARTERQHLALTALARTLAHEAEGVLAALTEARRSMGVPGGRGGAGADSLAVLREPVASREVDYEVALREQVETEEGLRWRYTGETTTVRVPLFDSARVTLARARPAGYLVAPHRGDLVEILLDHGLVVERVLAPARWSVEHFRIRELEVLRQPYEGYVPQRFRTELEAGEVELPAGGWFVPGGQPGAALLFHLMEPEDENSLAIMGAFLSEARIGGILPVHRVLEPPRVPRERVGRVGR